MRLANAKNIKAGTILANSIYNENGVVLLAKGMSLTEKNIQRLIQQGITYVYIEDELTKDIEVDSNIPDQLRIEATKAIKDLFLDVQKNGLDKKSFLLDKKATELKSVIRKLVEEIQLNEKCLSLLSDIYVSDNYLFQHSLNVTIYSLAIAKNLNFTNKELTEIGIGALLHDIGKIFIDPVVLQKPEKLTDEEYEIVQGHAQLGFDFLRKQPSFSSIIAHCAYDHHERLDGSGYPRRLKGNEIHPYAKLLGIADVFDAVTSNRIYRDAMLPHEGLEILYASAVNQFDKDMVEAFKKSVVVYPDGLPIELSDGKQGVVLRQNKHLCDRPIIRVLKDNGKDVASPFEFDLGKKINVTIVSVLMDKEV